MAVFPSDSIRTKNWGDETLTDADLESQLDLLHAYFQACLNATTGHAHTGSSNQGPKLSPANMTIASQATGDTLYASSATAWARLAKGTASQVLQMKSDASIPEWVSSGVTDGSLVRMTTGDKLPAVDGSLLTNLPISGKTGYPDWANKESKNENTLYQASADGWIMATANSNQATNPNLRIGTTSGVSDIVIMIAGCGANEGDVNISSILVPIKSSYYYQKDSSWGGQQPMYFVPNL